MNNKDIFDIVLAMKVRGGGSVTVLEDKTLTPDFSNGDVTVSPDEGYDALSSVTIEKDSDLVAGNIKKDVNVFGITGTLDSGDSQLDELIDGTLTDLNSYASKSPKTGFFKGTTSLMSARLECTGVLNSNMFEQCTNLISVDLPNVTNLGTYAFSECSKLTSINMPNILFIGGSSFFRCASLQSISFPNASTSGNSVCQQCSNLELADFKGGDSLGMYTFSGDSKFKTLILRKTNNIVTLPNTNAFTSTPFASGGTGGTLYVPQDLIESYQSANNWSTILGYANNQILAIEGSIYE